MRIKNIYGKSLILLILVFFSIWPHAFAGEGEEYSIIEKNQKKGLVNKKGRVLIPPEYEDLGWTNGGTQLLENVIGFKKDGLWGILNTKNEKITEPVYTSLTRFNEDWIVASKKLPYNSSIVFGVINAKGHAEVDFQYHRLFIHNAHLIASMHEEDKYLYGLLDERAKPVIPIRYDRVESITDHLYEVTHHDRVAVFDNEGNNLTDFSLDSIRLIHDEYVLTFHNGKRGLVSNKGNHVVDPIYKTITIEQGDFRAQKFRDWLVFTNTNEKVASYAYDEIEPKGIGIYKIKVGGAEALIHESDSLLTEFSNFEIRSQTGKWIAVSREGKSGILHIDGSMFLETVFDSIRILNNMFLIKHKLDGIRGWSMVNTYGKMITDQVYDKIDWLGDSYYVAKRDNFWGVLNSLGEEIIYCKYDSIVQYSDGKLLVEFLGEDGILNLDGKWEILPQNKEMEIVDPLRYLVRSPYGSYVAYYPETKDFTAEYFLYRHEGRYLEKTLDAKFGLLDEEGKRVIYPEFDEISELQEDSIYYARSEKEYSFITKSGKIMNEHDARFEAINNMTEEFIGVKIDGKWGFVDINGKLRVSNQYENVGPYNEGLAPIKVLGRWGYINKREDLVVQPSYDSVYQFKKGICKVVKKGKFGLINAEGNITLECIYDDITRLKTGGFLTKKGGKFGLASEKGRLLILPRFDSMADLDNGYVIASRKGKYGLLSNEGVNIIPMIYDELKYNPYNDVYLAAKSSAWINLNMP